MFRKPLFWIALLAISLGSVFFSAKYVSRAFPIVTLDLRMDREAALRKAAELAARFQLPPAGYREVASFGGDQEVQNFVELEGGGTQAFRNMIPPSSCLLLSNLCLFDSADKSDHRARGASLSHRALTWILSWPWTATVCR